MDSKISKINQLLCEKSYTKQKVYQITLETFDLLKSVLKELEEEIMPCIHEDAPNVIVKYNEIGQFEAHIKFSGDTLVVMMHTNIFDFDDSHYLNQSTYIKEDPMREFCGMIHIYNFLSDSLLYNREQDMGYLIARLFINKERHFFIEGKRPLAFNYADISKNEVKREVMKDVMQEAMLFCLNFDLLAPSLDAVKFISVEQKNALSFSSGMPTSKRMGFRMDND
jgi:hypothetical protein